MRPILSPEVRSLSAVEKPAASAGRSGPQLAPRASVASTSPLMFMARTASHITQDLLPQRPAGAQLGGLTVRGGGSHSEDRPIPGGKHRVPSTGTRIAHPKLIRADAVSQLDTGDRHARHR